MLPSVTNTAFAEIEFRRFYEYSRLALNKADLRNKLDKLLSEYNMTMEDILFKNDYANGGDLDE